MPFDTLCDNRTPLAVRCFGGDDAEGRDVVAVVAKLTYELCADGRCRLAAPQSPVRAASVRWDAGAAAARASLRYPSDAAVEKPGTDVLLLGTAHPLGEVAAQDVLLRVGGRIDKRLPSDGRWSSPTSTAIRTGRWGSPGPSTAPCPRLMASPGRARR